MTEQDVGVPLVKILLARFAKRIERERLTAAGITLESSEPTSIGGIPGAAAARSTPSASKPGPRSRRFSDWEAEGF